MNFAMSYSCGKDSTLALHKMLDSGHNAGCLLTMVNSGQGRSWFHGADTSMLRSYEKSLGIPVLQIPAGGEEYAAAFESALAKAKNLGVTACAFGDIDLLQNRLWEETRCEKSGLQAIFPLWDIPRQEIMQELLSLGYKCLIKAINPDKFPEAAQTEAENLSQAYLGRMLDDAFLRQLDNLGADICGENGEYHTLAVAGPIFRQPLGYRLGKIVRLPHHAFIEIEFT